MEPRWNDKIAEVVPEWRHQGQTPLERRGRSARHGRRKWVIKRDQRHCQNLDLHVQGGAVVEPSE